MTLLVSKGLILYLKSMLAFTHVCRMIFNFLVSGGLKVNDGDARREPTDMKKSVNIQ